MLSAIFTIVWLEKPKEVFHEPDVKIPENEIIVDNKSLIWWFNI